MWSILPGDGDECGTSLIRTLSRRFRDGTCASMFLGGWIDGGCLQKKNSGLIVFIQIFAGCAKRSVLLVVGGGVCEQRNVIVVPPPWT